MKKCPRQDSNLYAISGTGPSNQPVYQFQHVGSRLAGAQNQGPTKQLRAKAQRPEAVRPRIETSDQLSARNRCGEQLRSPALFCVTFRPANAGRADRPAKVGRASYFPGPAASGRRAYVRRIQFLVGIISPSGRDRTRTCDLYDVNVAL